MYTLLLDNHMIRGQPDWDFARLQLSREFTDMSYQRISPLSPPSVMRNNVHLIIPLQTKAINTIYLTTPHKSRGITTSKNNRESFIIAWIYILASVASIIDFAYYYHKYQSYALEDITMKPLTTTDPTFIIRLPNLCDHQTIEPNKEFICGD